MSETRAPYGPPPSDPPRPPRAPASWHATATAVLMGAMAALSLSGAFVGAIGRPLLFLLGVLYVGLTVHYGRRAWRLARAPRPARGSGTAPAVIGEGLPFRADAVVAAGCALVDAEATAAAHPDTFELLPLGLRRRLTVGDYAKVCAQGGGPNPINGGPWSERVWVQVTRVYASLDGHWYWGELQSQPVGLPLAVGAPVHFQPRHVYDARSDEYDWTREREADDAAEDEGSHHA